MATATQVTYSPTTLRLRKILHDGYLRPSLAQSSKVEREEAKHTDAGSTNTGSWGRHNSPNSFTLLSSISIMLFCPVLVMVFHLACASYQGSLPALGKHFLAAPVNVMRELLPPLSVEGLFIGLGWVALQTLLWFAIPAPMGTGSRTPSGNVLRYPMNGLRIFFINHLCFGLGVATGLFKGSIFYDHRGDLLVLANLYGALLALFCFAKAYRRPSYPEDRKFSGNVLYDFYMGIELNPRIGSFDIKLFHNERIGIELWSLMNLSYAAKQFELHGHVTNSMIAVNLLHLLYIVDFFCNEDWYLRTIDIAHDHFGWMLAWGDAVWLPFVYTLPGMYLVTSPVNLPNWVFFPLLCFGLAGYVIFRGANWERNHFRQTQGKEPIWGSDPQFITATYRTTDGRVHTSTLLHSGFWGLARHINYLGDMMMALTYGLSCGISFIPLFYFFYLTTLLVHRSLRDDARCKAKYHAAWEEYCRRVPDRIIPNVY